MSDGAWCRSLDDKSRKELQALAKANGIKANLSSEKIISALVATKSASASPAVPPRSASRGVVRPFILSSPLERAWQLGIDEWSCRGGQMMPSAALAASPHLSRRRRSSAASAAHTPRCAPIQTRADVSVSLSGLQL